MSITLVKKSNAKKAKKSGKAAPGDFALVVGEDGSVEVFGTDAAGDQIDISELATIAVTSSDPGILTVDTPVGMKFTETAVAEGHADVAIVATWNDGSIGPFNATDPVDVQKAPPGPVTGLIIVHGTPTVH